MRFGSLFSGIGGFDAGFEAVDMECAWQVELDGDCNRVLERHWPAVKRFRDVKETGRHNLKPVDLICGGFPCQDLSVAGKREGLAGERSGLWYEFHRILAGLRPRWCVIENVPGLLSSLEGGDFAIILRGLVELGYGVAYRVLDAQYFGVAQRRRRVFIVGSLGDGRAAQVLFESESLSRNPAESREARARVASPITKSFAKHGGRTAGNNGAADNMIVPDIAYCISAAEGGRFGSGRDAQDTFIAHTLRAEADAGEDGTGRGTPLVVSALDVCNSKEQPDGISGTIQSKKSGGYSLNYLNPVLAFSSKDSGADAGELAPTLRSMNYDESHINGGGQVAVAFAENQRGEVRTGEISPQLSCSGGKPGSGYSAVAFQLTSDRDDPNVSVYHELHPSLNANPMSDRQANIAGNFGVRRLTPRECERLQGFPDDWTRWDASGKEISDSARYRMLGNAVCAPVAKWIGWRIMEAECVIESG